MGLSNKLLQQDHHKVYFEGTPKDKGKTLRRHGDEVEQLENGYYRMHGRVDDAMNLGGIKVSSIQIEEVLNQLEVIKESHAIALSPKDGGPSILVVYYVENNNRFEPKERLQLAKKIIKEQLNPLFKVNDLVKIDILPRTASGKVMRRKLRNLFSE
jgi:acetyl-CoA synthetase